MSKIKRALSITLVALMIICAMPLTALAANVTENSNSLIKTVYMSGDSCTEEEFKEIIFDEPQPTKESLKSLDALALNSKGYHYTCLTDSFEKKVYNTLYGKVTPVATLSVSFDTDLLNGVYYSDNYSLANYIKNNYANKLFKAAWCYRYDHIKESDPFRSSVSWDFSFTYNSSTRRITSGEFYIIFQRHQYYNSSLETIRDNRIKQIANVAAQKHNLYDRMKYIHDELVKTSYYDYDSLEADYDDEIFFYAHSSFGILNNGIGVCESYAKAFKLVCDYLDLAPVVCDISPTHMWNAVYVDDKWYCVDLTWDDPVRGVSSYISYDYFLCNDPDVVDGTSDAHTSDPYVLRPNYASSKYNLANHIHSFTYFPSVAPTYLKTGVLEHYECKTCYGLYAANKTTPIYAYQTIIPKLEDVSGCDHSFTKILPRVPATTTKDGLTQGVVCQYCEFPHTEQEVIPRIDSIKLDHTSYTYTGSTKKPTFIVKDRTGAEIDDSNYSVSYSPSSPRNPGTHYATVKFRNNYSGSKKLSFKIVLKKPTVKTSSTASSIKLRWSKVSGISGYKVYSSSKKLIKDNKTSTSYTAKCSSGKTYTYYVRSYKKVGSKTYYSDYVKVSTTTLPKTPSVSSSSTSKTVKLTWKKVTGATGYAVYNSSKKLLGTTSSKTKTITGLSSNKTYTFYVRAYRTYNGKKYYSGYKKVSRATLTAAPTIKYTPTSTTIKFYWSKVSGAKGYCIYNQDKRLMSDLKTKTSYTAKNLKKGGTYTVYVRSYKTVSGKRKYSDYRKLTASTTLATPKFKVISRTTTSITYKAPSVYGATGYAIYNSSKKLLKDNINRNSFMVYELPAGKSYTCYFRAYKIIDGKRIYSPYQKVTYSTLKPTASIKISSTSKTIQPGYYTTLTATTTPSGYSVSWSSSNSNIATVDQNGKVVGKNVGTATITAYFYYEGTKYSATCKITVSVPTYSALGYGEVPDFGKAVGNGTTYSYIETDTFSDGAPYLYLVYDYDDINWDGQLSLSLEIYESWLNQKGIYYDFTSDDGDSFYYTKQTTNGLLVVCITLLSDGDLGFLIWYNN